MNGPIYVSRISADDIDFDTELEDLQVALDEQGLDHFKDKRGRVFPILGQLNKKSVPVNSANPSDPQRVNFTSVVSFGHMQMVGEPAAPVAEVEDAVREVYDQDAVEVVEAEREHALLSSSGAHRWLNCPPSAKLEDEAEDTAGAAAAEGTAAHALAEHKLRRALKQRSDRPTSPYEDDAMGDYTDAYVTYVLEKYEAAKQVSPDADILIEQRLDFSHLVPGGFGTGDCVIVADGHMTVIDFKYGAGVLVDAWNNPQMQLYALGALAELDMLYDIDTVEMVIYQPRRDSISEWTQKVTELTEWGETIVKPTAELAATGGGEMKAGDWCGFCKLKHTCRTRAKANLEIAQWEFEDPAELTDAEIAEALALIPQAKAWMNDLERYANSKAVDEGKRWPGFKLVAGRSIRKYTDPEAVAAAAEAAGYTDIFDRKLIGVTAMEKLMGKQTFADVLGALVHKPEGKPTLVPESDRRPAVKSHSAADDFGAN